MKGMDAGIRICTLLRASLLKAPLDVTPFTDANREDWEEIFVISCPHHLTALLYDSIAALPEELRPPRDIVLKFAVVTDRIESAYSQKESITGELAGFLSGHGIDVMLLKGIGISRYYPVPQHRGSSDIDIYMYGQERRADSLLAGKWGVSVSDDVHHHTTFVIGGVLVENHYDFVNTHDHRSARETERVLKELAAVPGSVLRVGGHDVKLPPANFNALFLMRHMAAHYAAERISLRHLCDWMVFLLTEHENINFDLITGYWERFNLHRFAAAVNGILIERFGMDETVLPAFTRERALENRIFNDILSPEFAVKRPASGTVKIMDWKLRRFMANRWKHRIVYNEPWWITLFQSSAAHLMKPKTIKH